ncbi:hypothetical protein TNCV_4465431 [Trichonephila clavipes]|nr:hypothetical protein TNCV_4465431 [Trichonephila clavipes]
MYLGVIGRVQPVNFFQALRRHQQYQYPDKLFADGCIPDILDAIDVVSQTSSVKVGSGSHPLDTTAIGQRTVY